MPTLCPQCDPKYYAVCDFCLHYTLSGPHGGSGGWCKRHKRQEDAGGGCEDFHCQDAVVDPRSHSNAVRTDAEGR